MKTMNCSQLGGPQSCTQEFTGNTFEEIAEQSKEHGMLMLQRNEPDHLQAMEKMREIMISPEAMNEWMDARKAEFEALAN